MKNICVKLISCYLITLIWPAQAGVFEFAGDDHGITVITHPTGYSGRGEELVVTVGIAPLSVFAVDMEIPVLNAINTWNQLVPTIGNVVNDTRRVPQNMFDFESVVLHELGHCIGLGHPNLASESGLSGDDRDFTSTTRGENNRFDLNRGADGVIGSVDDRRGDDTNLHWFSKADNNPFVLPEIIDRTTYSLDLDDLPPGHFFAANAEREYSLLLGLPVSEAVMQQGIFAGESRRTLVADDIATLRIAMSGLDGVQGTSDDYTLVLQYAGFTENADIVIDFDDAASFSACRITAVFLPQAPDHFVIRSGHISFNSGFDWFFNPVQTLQVEEQPTVSIQVNNQLDNTVTLQTGDQLSLKVALAPGRQAGNQADYWVRAETPLGDFWLNQQLRFVRSDRPVRAHGGPLVDLAPLTILDIPVSDLPAGTYTVTFAVDDNRDLVFDETYRSSVSFTLLP